ncbi:MAG TPA: T9SS type A sorting domain-containing protein [Candidatus Kapabacteria bacterium]|nr:T9SS type A sorting domain-containing protein [Candidatus Kapabacteria bacterium]
MKNLFILFAISCLLLVSTAVQAQWVQLNGLSDSANGHIWNLAVIGNRILAGTGNTGMFVSTDSGATWLPSGLQNKDISILTDSGAKIYVSGGAGVMQSLDSGKTWSSIDSNLPVQSLAVSGGTIFAGMYYGGLYITTDDGVSWNLISLRGQTVYSLFVYGGILLASADSGIILSTDNGVTWSNRGEPNEVTSFAALNGNIFAGTGDHGVYKSTDNGYTWSVTSMSTGWVYKFIVSGTNIFGATNNGVILSTDSGTSWHAVDNGFPIVYNQYPEVNALAISGGYIFAGTDIKGIWRRGLSEASTVSGVVALHPTIISLRAPHPTVTQDTIALRNTGNSPIIIDSIFGTRPWISVKDPDTVAVGDSIKIIVTLQDSSQESDTGYILIVTNDSPNPVDSVMVIYQGTTAVVETNVPAFFALAQNYPNPFSATTQIDFSLPESGHATLKVYNSLGEEVATLVDGNQSAGQHSAAFDGNNLQNGMYFYRLSAGKFSQTGKMTVVH